MSSKSVGMMVVVGVVYVGLVVAVVKVQRAASSPDFGRTARMGAWRGVKTFADRRAMRWGDIGLMAGTKYNRCRNGV